MLKEKNVLKEHAQIYNISRVIKTIQLQMLLLSFL